MRSWVVVAMAATIAACGGSGGTDDSPGGLAAQACKAELERRLEGKLYEMDLAALAASMKDAGNGTKMLSVPVVTEPGLTSEARQVMECTVRFAEGKTTPDIVGFGFNW
jgi:hypothetical protein